MKSKWTVNHDRDAHLYLPSRIKLHCKIVSRSSLVPISRRYVQWQAALQARDARCQVVGGKSVASSGSELILHRASRNDQAQAPARSEVRMWNVAEKERGLPPEDVKERRAYRMTRGGHGTTTRGMDHKSIWSGSILRRESTNSKLLRLAWCTTPVSSSVYPPSTQVDRDGMLRFPSESSGCLHLKTHRGIRPADRSQSAAYQQGSAAPCGGSLVPRLVEYPDLANLLRIHLW